MKTVRTHREARLELYEITDWYESKAEGIGLDFLADAEAALEALPRRSLLPLPGFPGFLYAKVGARWPYRIFVMERDDIIVVLAFAHDRRRPGYWLDRADP